MRTRLLVVTTVALVAFSGATEASTIYLEVGGQVVVEAENFSARTPGATAQWVSVPAESAGGVPPFDNFRGAGYIEAFPDIGGGSISLEPPFADYDLRINTPGTYQLYTRWDSRHDNSDTVYASILQLHDGLGGTIADWYRYVSIVDDADFATRPWHGVGGFERTDSPFSNGETPILWTIATAGLYTLRYTMREDGVGLDAFVLQLSTLAAPIGEGPPQSPTERQPVPEPGSLGLLAVGLLAGIRRRLRSAVPRVVSGAKSLISRI